MAHSPTDAEIIARSLDDPEAFAEIFDRHFERIRRFAVSRAGRDHGPDIASETFVVAFRKRRSYNPDYEDCSYWLFGIAGNLIRTHRRSLGRKARALEREARRADLVVVEDEDVADRLDAGTDMARLSAGLARLRPKYREPLLLHCWEELSYQEISEVLGIPVGTVRSRISRARDKIRELMDTGGQ